MSAKLNALVREAAREAANPPPVCNEGADAVAALGENPSAEAVEKALRTLARDLVGADALRIATAGAAAVKALDEAGIRRAAALVDIALAPLRQRPERAEDAPRTLDLPDVEPHPDAVAGDALLGELVRMLTKYMKLPEGAATAVALWIVFSYAHDAFVVSPLLAITSPEKRCGKTTLLTLLSALCPRVLPASNISASAIFRAVEKFRPTLLVDEADTFLTSRDASDELRGILNSGHTRATARVLRSVKVGDAFEVEVCSTWAPKAVALIGELPSTLADRSIDVRLARKAPGDRVEQLRLDRIHEEAGELARKAARWAQDHLDQLRDADPDTPAELHDRAADNWRPLLAIADAAGGAWPDRARRAARALHAIDEDDSAGVLLLTDLKNLFGQTERLASAEIVAALGTMENRPWPEWRAGKPITARQVARLLKPFGIHPTKIRFGATTANGYEREKFRDAFSRYIPPSEPEQPEQPSNDAENRAFAIRNNTPRVPDVKTPENPHGDCIVPVVPDETPGTPQKRELERL